MPSVPFPTPQRWSASLADSAMPGTHNGHIQYRWNEFILFPFYRWENWGLGREDTSPNDTTIKTLPTSYCAQSPNPKGLDASPKHVAHLLAHSYTQEIASFATRTMKSSFTSNSFVKLRVCARRGVNLLSLKWHPGRPTNQPTHQPWAKLLTYLIWGLTVRTSPLVLSPDRHC